MVPIVGRRRRCIIIFIMIRSGTTIIGFIKNLFEKVGNIHDILFQ